MLVISDQFSKWAEFLPVPDQTARVCAKLIFDEIICRWGCPLSIHSDQGSSYESEVFKELCQLLEVRKTSSVRRPQGNGQVERLNRSLLGMIRAYLCGEQTDWDLHLPCLAFAYRSSPHESSGMTANLLMTGREARLPAELAFTSGTSINHGEKVTSYGEYVETLKNKMQRAHEIARKHLHVASKRNKELYDTKVSINKYSEGVLVWLLNEARHLGSCPKLEMVYEGPYLIKQKISQSNFVIQLDGQGRQKLVHHNKLKPYKGENPPKWIHRARKNTRCEKKKKKRIHVYNMYYVCNVAVFISFIMPLHAATWERYPEKNNPFIIFFSVIYSVNSGEANHIIRVSIWYIHFL